MTDKRGLSTWFTSPLGQRLLQQERRVLERILPQLFGYHLLQIGCASHGELLDSSRIGHRCLLNLEPQTVRPPYTQVCAESQQLPFATDSIDVVVLSHALEFAAEPHQILREVERVLIPEGHLILVGFNPFSLWGLRRWLEPCKSAPWHGKFRGLLRIKDWLSLLGFETQQQYALFVPPFSSPRLLASLAYTAESRGRWWAHLSGVYVIVSKKRVATLTPLKPRWLSKSVLSGEGAVRPTTRSCPPHD